MAIWVLRDDKGHENPIVNFIVFGTLVTNERKEGAYI